MNETCRELLETYYETNKIPVCIVEQDGEILLSVPEQETEILPEQFRRLCVQDFQFQRRDREHPLVLALEPSYFVGVAQMDPSAYLIFGPVSPVRHTPEEIRKSSIPFVSVEQLSAFGTAVSQTPLMGSRVFVNAFCVACYLAGGVYVPGESVFLCNNTAVSDLSGKELQREIFYDREEPLGHTSYEYETGLMDAVRSGNSKLLRARIFQPYAGRAGKMSNDPIRQERYVFLSVLTSATRAAIDGGVPQEEAFSLSDSFSLRVDTMEDEWEISVLMYEMLLTFCSEVKKHRLTAGYSRPVRQCLDYILIHLHETITLDTLADLPGMCTKAISQKFRQETGLSVRRYIKEQKIREAKQLLSGTDYSYIDISNYLNFCTQSHFIQAFREITGMTPQEYRERN